MNCYGSKHFMLRLKGEFACEATHKQGLFKFESVISSLCVRPVVTSQRRVSSMQQMVKSRKGKEVTGGLRK